jgi:hypothetical protein
LDVHEERIGRLPGRPVGLDDFFAPAGGSLYLAFVARPHCGSDRSTFTGGSMDLIVAAVVAALAAVSFVWLAFVERA